MLNVCKVHFLIHKLCLFDGTGSTCQSIRQGQQCQVKMGYPERFIKNDMKSSLYFNHTIAPHITYWQNNKNIFEDIFQTKCIAVGK